MNKHLPRKITDIKGKVALAELQRTHIIVFILTLVVIALIVLLTISMPGVNMILFAAAIALLILLAVISLSTAVGLSRLIKK